MPLIFADPCKLLYTVTDHSSQGRLQIFHLIVEVSASPWLGFFPTKGTQG
jgi:hypothetical protein